MSNSKSEGLLESSVRRELGSLTKMERSFGLGLSTVQGNNNPTDQRDKAVGVEREGLEGGRIGGGELWREGVKRLFIA